jgi:hypothetical protein
VGWGWDEPTFLVFGWESVECGISHIGNMLEIFGKTGGELVPGKTMDRGDPTSTPSSLARAISAGFLSLPVGLLPLLRRRSSFSPGGRRAHAPSSQRDPARASYG